MSGISSALGICPKCNHPWNRHAEMPYAGIEDEGVVFCLIDGCKCMQSMDGVTVPNAAGMVEIHRRRGRIAGFAKPPCQVETLWCGTNRPRKKFGRRRNGWSFPPAVRELLLQQTKGSTVLHLFGGLADFGVRLDVDPETKP